MYQNCYEFNTMTMTQTVMQIMMLTVLLWNSVTNAANSYPLAKTTDIWSNSSEFSGVDSLLSGVLVPSAGRVVTAWTGLSEKIKIKVNSCIIKQYNIAFLPLDNVVAELANKFTSLGVESSSGGSSKKELDEGQNFEP